MYNKLFIFLQFNKYMEHYLVSSNLINNFLNQIFPNKDLNIRTNWNIQWRRIYSLCREIPAKSSRKESFARTPKETRSVKISKQRSLYFRVMERESISDLTEADSISVDKHRA